MGNNCGDPVAKYRISDIDLVNANTPTCNQSPKEHEEFELSSAQSVMRGTLFKHF